MHHRAVLILACALVTPAQAQEPTQAQLCDAAAPMWSVKHKVDEISDAKTCTVSLENPGWSIDGGLFFVSINGAAAFSVLGDEYPGEESAIRVDSNAPHIFREMLQGARAARLVRELEAGDYVVTRYIEWPSGAPSTARHQICDLPQKIRECLGPE